MKKTISVILLLMFMGLSAQASSFKTAISKYKAGNFAGCINELDNVSEQISNSKDNESSTKKLIKIISKYNFEKWKEGNQKDEDEARKMLKEIQKEVPRATLDKWAYLFYYYALSFHQLGYKKEAKEYYRAAEAFTWESKSQIFLYSKQAIKCIDNPTTCQSSDMDEFIKSGKPVSDEIIKEELKRNLQKHKKEINAGKELSALPAENEKLAWADAGISPEVSDSVSDSVSSVNKNMPTDEEIGKAVRILHQAGINPMSYMNNANNEYAQLNALLNDGNSNYSSNDYYTMMMMNGANKMSPQLMQTFMQQQMMGGFGF